VHRAPDGSTASGVIVEVEAYCGPRDLACHSSGGRRTARNEVMYGPAGHAYIYFTYGMHFCLNVVTRGAGIAEAILIRAAVPIAGIERMRERRAAGESAPSHLLARGPGNLCRAFAIDKSLNGADLTDSPLTLYPGTRFAPAQIRHTPRIGIDYAAEYVSRPWRLCVKGEPAVSGKR
jgi:DNA-3-methyladenine glycosylase